MAKISQPTALLIRTIYVAINIDRRQAQTWWDESHANLFIIKRRACPSSTCDCKSL